MTTSVTFGGRLLARARAPDDRRQSTGATHVLEVHVDSCAADLGKTLGDPRIVSIYARIESQHLRRETGFVRTTCDPDHARAPELGDLSRYQAGPHTR